VGSRSDGEEVGGEDEFRTRKEAVETGAEVAKTFLENRLELPPAVYTLEIKN